MDGAKNPEGCEMCSFSILFAAVYMVIHTYYEKRTKKLKKIFQILLTKRARYDILTKLSTLPEREEPRDEKEKQKNF